MLELLSNLAPWGAAIAAIVVAWFADRRARKAHAEKQAVDHAELINQAYQSILDELRAEITRRELIHQEERRDWNRVEQQLRDRVAHLEARVEALETELTAVEKRYGFHNEGNDNG